MTFPETDAVLRKDYDFLGENVSKFSDHCIRPSTFAEGAMVTQFPLDYMHLVCLCVMQRLITLCREKVLCKKELYQHKWILFHNRMLCWAPLCLQNLHRITYFTQCWSLKSYWVLPGFFFFFLYTGPFVLKIILLRAQYRNFMLFYVAIWLLLTPRFCHSYCDYAHSFFSLYNTLVTFMERKCLHTTYMDWYIFQGKWSYTAASIIFHLLLLKT